MNTETMKDTDTEKKKRQNWDNQLRIAFPDPDEGQEVSGETICGTCGKEIQGDVYWNRLGPAHRMCVPVA